MDDIINYLQNIQNNLIGLVLPVLITAFVSLVTLLVNTIMQITLQNSKFNSEQYTLMQVFYPKFKTHLLELKLIIQEMESSSMCSDLTTSIAKYIDIKKDEPEYRKRHSNELPNIDSFNTLMEALFTKLISMNDYLKTAKIPRPPIMHPLLGIKINKLLAVIQYYSFLFSGYRNRTINEDIFQQELENYNKKAKMDYKKLKSYLSILDKWVLKY